jgi:hypothetical protein
MCGALCCVCTTRIKKPSGKNGAIWACGCLYTPPSHITHDVGWCFYKNENVCVMLDSDVIDQGHTPGKGLKDVHHRIGSSLLYSFQKCYAMGCARDCIKKYFRVEPVTVQSVTYECTVCTPNYLAGAIREHSMHMRCSSRFLWTQDGLGIRLRMVQTHRGLINFVSISTPRHTHTTLPRRLAR